MMTMLETSVAIAREAGEVLMRYFRNGVRTVDKGAFDVVTEADLQAERQILKRIEEAFPDHAIVSEERGASGESDWCWYVDPLDGTKNFAHGHPAFCTMLALYRSGAPQLAVTHDPVRGEMFTAVAGEGAFCNGERIGVSGVRELGQALLTTGFPSSKRHRDATPSAFFEVLMMSQAMRRTGCSGLDLAYVAAGRFDGLWEQSLRPWDVAGGVLMVHEAGGACVTWEGERFRLGDETLIASNPHLTAALTGILTSGR
jgi:myo-inositol-1(or 4)-monophosphatase